MAKIQVDFFGLFVYFIFVALPLIVLSVMLFVSFLKYDKCTALGYDDYDLSKDTCTLKINYNALTGDHNNCYMPSKLKVPAYIFCKRYLNNSLVK